MSEPMSKQPSTDSAGATSEEPDRDESEEADVEPDDTPPRPEENPTRDLLKLEIDVREDPFTIAELVRKIDAKPPRLILAPDFQRKEVWDRTRRSRFIESVLLNYPLPPLYLNQRRDGTYLVVDGLQRTSSIYRFVHNEYPLQDLETLTWLNGLQYDELEPLLRARIEDRKLNCYVLKPSVPFGVVHDIFTRINTGGMLLNRQELRHAFYQGPAIELLKRLAALPRYHDWLGKRLSPKRMGDQEAALRCIAFVRCEPATDYKGSMDTFLNNTLQSLNEPKAELEHSALMGQFERVIAQLHDVLGEDALRLPTTKTRGRLNLAVMESIYRVFAQHDATWSAHNRGQLQANYAALLNHDKYRAAVSLATSGVTRVRDRFRIAREILEVGCV
jgi:hypothetical protein